MKRLLFALTMASLLTAGCAQKKVFHLTVPQSWRGIPIDVFDE